MELNRKPRDDPIKLFPHTFDKVTKAVKWKKASIFIRWNWINCMSMGKYDTINIYQSKPQNFYQRIASRLSASKIIKLLEDNMSPRHVEEFLSMPPKTYSLKIKR